MATDERGDRAVDGPPMELLVFEIAGRRYGVPATTVRELLRAVAVAPVPGTSDMIEGLIDVRGELMPVIDLSARLGLPRRPIASTDHLIVVADANGPAAIRVDRATDLVRLETSQLRTLAPGVSPSGRSLAVATLPDGLVILHEPWELVRDARRARAPSQEHGG